MSSSQLEQPQTQQEETMMSLPSELKYPVDRERAGSAWWSVIHNMAAQYPSKPTEIDRRKMRNFLNYLISNFVCIDCVNHAAAYIKNNRIDFSSRNSLSEYFCRMHNDVNQKLGKPIVDCDSILDGKHVRTDTATCTTCNVKRSASTSEAEKWMQSGFPKCGKCQNRITIEPK